MPHLCIWETMVVSTDMEELQQEGLNDIMEHGLYQPFCES